MRYTIENKYVKVKISSKGAEIQSIKGYDGIEYIWQGDKDTWEGHAPNLFPYIARLTYGKYRYKNKEYKMDIHGLAMYSEFKVVQKESDRISFTFESNEETKLKYPFEFCFCINYILVERKLIIQYRVVNYDIKKMYFGVGGHPGFCVPLDSEEEFNQYYLKFSEKLTPIKIGMSEDCYVTGINTPFELRENQYLDLHHELFNDDAIILGEMANQVTLKSRNGLKSITVTYPQMKYLGIWHWPKVAVNYVCIEPWTSLPSRKNIVEDLELQEDLVGLEPNEVYQNEWSIEI
ncbi:MAG: aldose 1-epimerase family protein [Clostridium sp.]